MIGLVVTSSTSFSVVIRAETSTASMSGFPLAVESVRELPHMPSNSRFPVGESTLVCSMIRPLRALWISRKRRRGFACSIRRRDFSLTSGVVPISLRARCRFVEEMPFVYGTSMSCPPHSAKVSMTRFLVPCCTPSFQSSPWTTKSGL